MTDRKILVSRRPVIAGLAAVTAATVFSVAYDLTAPKHKRATGPYADLVNRLDNPAAAATVGTAILAHARNRDVAIEAAHTFASHRLTGETLTDATTTDIAQNFLTEANGWVMPITLGALCVLATVTN